MNALKQSEENRIMETVWSSFYVVEEAEYSRGEGSAVYLGGQGSVICYDLLKAKTPYLGKGIYLN